MSDDDGDRPRSFAEQSDRIRVTAKSPDGSVTALLDRATGVRVELAPGTERDHSEESLARQVAAALTGAAAGGATGLDKVNQHHGGARPETVATGPQAEYLDRLKQRLSEVEVRSLSPRGYVQIGYRGASGFDIRIEPGALRRRGVDAEQLTVEINTALQQALRNWTGEWLRLRVEAATA